MNLKIINLPTLGGGGKEFQRSGGLYLPTLYFLPISWVAGFYLEMAFYLIAGD